MCKQKSCVNIECHKSNKTKQFCFLNRDVGGCNKKCGHDIWPYDQMVVD
jgi:hypothetical protein